VDEIAERRDQRLFCPKREIENYLKFRMPFFTKFFFVVISVAKRLVNHCGSRISKSSSPDRESLK